MTCDQREDQIVTYALGALAGPEREELRAHLDGGCRQCSARLSEVQGVLDVLPLGLDPVAPPAELRARLLERVRSARQPDQAAPVAVSPRRLFTWLRWTEALAAGIVAAGITAAVFWSFLQRQQRTVALLQQDITQLQTQIRQLRGALSQNTQVIHLLQSPAVQLVSLEGTAARPQAKARVFWDKDRNAWHMYVTGLKPTPPGKTYELWLINSEKKKIPAGTFDVNAQGEGTAFAKAPSEAGQVVALAVTNEPAGGVPQPTGQIQLLGRVP